MSTTRAVTALAALIHDSQQRRSTAYGIALDVDREDMLLTPEIREELERLRETVACDQVRDMLASAERENRELRADRDRYRSAWLSARGRAVAYGEGILRVVEDREAYQSWLKTAEARVDTVERAYVFDTAALKKRVAELEAEVATASAPQHDRMADAEDTLRTVRTEGGAS